ncbi:MAG: alkaline phosphatase family protein [Methanothrix sp.]|uniref:alkaline phosphatase family protein n=1 Tax=Methanothrix sp. TaxID=90426 RepID=UPI0025FDF5B6|nr:alkaline phosphatase family protein [Methanothrix sp.]MCQ8903914.1 alkaline phosphatase family protein [Methanothrix sp.]
MISEGELYLAAKSISNQNIMRTVSQTDIAPSIARSLGIRLPNPDGRPIYEIERWRCKRAILIIVDSLGYELYRSFLQHLKHMREIVATGFLFRALHASDHTSPAIASILSGLTPEHHGIYDTESAKRSPILSLPEIASSSGLRSAVIMEKGGAEVYDGLIEYIGAVPRTLPPEEFDQHICRLTVEALSTDPDLVVSYFIGLDKAAHNGLNLDGFVKAAVSIDAHIGEIFRRAGTGTVIVIVGDHPVHAGHMKNDDDRNVALIIGRKT